MLDSFILQWKRFPFFSASRHLIIPCLFWWVQGSLRIVRQPGSFLQHYAASLAAHGSSDCMASSPGLQQKCRQTSLSQLKSKISMTKIMYSTMRISLKCSLPFDIFFRAIPFLINWPKTKNYKGWQKMHGSFLCILPFRFFKNCIYINFSFTSQYASHLSIRKCMLHHPFWLQIYNFQI